MPSTYSTNLKIELQATGENAGIWGTITNANLGTALEQAIVGYAAATFPADDDLTLTYADTNAAQTARALVLTTNSSVSLSATRNLIVPAIQKQYVVQNGTTGGQSIVVKTPTGTGITVPNGRKAHLYVDGTNVVVMDDYIPADSNNSYAIAPNLLIGTTTNFNTTNNPGAIASVGRGKYTFTTGTTGSGESTFLYEGIGFAYQPPLIVATGSTSDTNFYNDGSIFVYPRLSNNGTGGTSRAFLVGIRSTPNAKGTAATAPIQSIGVYGVALRSDADDISTASSNYITGLRGAAGHTFVDSANKPNIYTRDSFGVLAEGYAYAGRTAPSGVSMNVLAAVSTTIGITSYTAAGSTEVNNAARHWGSAFTIGTTSGPTAVVTNAFGLHMPGPTVAATGTVTNYYGVYLTAPTVTGTLTNRWAIYSLDASSPSYFAGSIQVGAGTAAAPTLTTIADTNTGIFFPTADNVSITTGGTERVRINSSGNVGFGYPAQTWGAGALALQLGPGYEAGAIVAEAPANVFNVVHNARWDGTNWIYSNSAAVSRYFTDRGNGAHVFQTAPVGTQYTTVTLSERLRIKQTGQVRFFPLAAAPSGAENGDVYYDSTTNKLRVYAGGVWTDLH